MKIENLIAKSLTQKLSLPEFLEVYDEISKTLDSNLLNQTPDEKYYNLTKIQDIIGLNLKVFNEYTNQKK